MSSVLMLLVYITVQAPNDDQSVNLQSTSLTPTYEIGREREREREQQRVTVKAHHSSTLHGSAWRSVELHAPPPRAASSTERARVRCPPPHSRVHFAHVLFVCLLLLDVVVVVVVVVSLLVS
jgi:hypothetical protein